MRCPVTNSPPFHSPSMPSIVAGGRLAQKSSSSASLMLPARFFSSVNFLRANDSLIAISFSDPARCKVQQRVVFLPGADRDPDAVSAIGADHNTCVGRLFDEV